MSRTITLSLSMLFAFVLSACKIVQGSGWNIEQLGENIAEEFQEAQ